MNANESTAFDRLHQDEEYILSNQLEQIAAHLCGLSGRRLDLLLDNAGFEFICDLALIDLAFERGWAGEVVLHVKGHPTFVSDVIAENVSETIRYISEQENTKVQTWGRRLSSAMQNGRIRVRADYFWNYPVPYWQMPERLISEFARCGLAISKGDLNYRRLTGELRWPADKPFQQVAGTFPCPLGALRTCKSDVVTGLRSGLAEVIARRDPEWRVNGRWGLAQWNQKDAED